MASTMRRPRVKATANLHNLKRKLNPNLNKELLESKQHVETDATPVKKNVIEILNITISNEGSFIKETQDVLGAVISDVHNKESSNKNCEKQLNNECETDSNIYINQSNNTNSVCPPQKNNETELEDRSVSNTTASKLQSRTRIKPVLNCGQRRNSLLNIAFPSQLSEDNKIGSEENSMHRKESGSLLSKTLNSSPNLHCLLSKGRNCTESNYSACSETHSILPKSRRVDENRSLTRRYYETHFIKGIPDKSSLKMCDLIYYNPVTNPMEQKSIMSDNTKNNNKSTETPNTEVVIEPKSTEEQSTEAIKFAVPQLKLNSNGELILDDKSLEIETTAEQDARKILENSSLIYIDENTGTNGFYKKHKRTKEWTSDDTVKFYRCLQTIGTDFSLISQLFPTRSRRDLKLKFKKEERCNGTLINKALLFPKTFNLQELKTQLDEEEKRAIENAKNSKDIQIDKVKPRKKIRKTYASHILHSDIYNDDNILENDSTEQVKSTTPLQTNYIETNKRTRHTNPTKPRKKKDLLRQEESISSENIEEFASQTIINMDINIEDSDTNVVIDESNNEDLYNVDNPTYSPTRMDLAECDIQNIISELAEGSLVLVSTLDPENADKVLNEIFLLNKTTGELSDEPLNIPESIVHSILSMMN